MTQRSYPAIGLLEGKVAVITGAGRGIGRVTARLFVEQGARVLAADVSGEEAATAAELSDAAESFHVDVRSEDDIFAMFAAALARFGRVDASIHAAGNLAAAGARRSPPKSSTAIAASIFAA